MAGAISDRDSAAACLRLVQALAARLDLHHPDLAYQASKADQLVRAATDLAHDLRVLAEGQRLRRHLAEAHGRTDLAEVDHNADRWASDHRDYHHAGVPTGTAHAHNEGSNHDR
jgi:hypothetical protein